nr:kinesin-like protein KIN-5C [Ipomoea batatas]
MMDSPLLQKDLNQTTKLLVSTEEELRQCQYALKERDFIISEHKKAAREDKLSADNRSVVNGFQAELANQLGSVCNRVAMSMSQQSEHLQCVRNSVVL